MCRVKTYQMIERQPVSETAPQIPEEMKWKEMSHPVHNDLRAME